MKRLELHYTNNTFNDGKGIHADVYLMEYQEGNLQAVRADVIAKTFIKIPWTDIHHIRVHHDSLANRIQKTLTKKMKFRGISKQSLHRAMDRCFGQQITTEVIKVME